MHQVKLPSVHVVSPRNTLISVVGNIDIYTGRLSSFRWWLCVVYASHVFIIWRQHSMTSTSDDVTSYCAADDADTASYSRSWPELRRYVNVSWASTSWAVQICPKQIQDGGQPPSWKKTINRNISTTDLPILTKFDTVMRLGPSQIIKFHEFKISRWRCGYFERSKNCNISPMDVPILTKFCTVTCHGSPDPRSNKMLPF